MGRALCLGLRRNRVGVCAFCRRGAKFAEYGNPERVASFSPGLPYSATLGNVSENCFNPERVEARRVPRSVSHLLVTATTPLGLCSLSRARSQGS
jgi:hypothetical protein